MRIHTQIETTDKGTSWVIKNSEEVTICRSPEKYRSRKKALRALDLFLQTIEAQDNLVHAAIVEAEERERVMFGVELTRATKPHTTEN